jgi:hypothetical protein
MDLHTSTNNKSTNETSTIAAYLARLAAADAAAGDRATATRLDVLHRRGDVPGPYAFPPDRSEVRRIDWVHRGWLRPVRFVFRHMPVGLRRLVKKAAT